MKWTALIAEIANRTELDERQVRACLKALSCIVREELAEGRDVPLKGVGVLSSYWKKGRVLRSVHSRRKMWVGGRLVPRFRASSALRELLASHADDSWRSPEHQRAWRLAETLVGDLALYHPDVVPTGIEPSTPPEQAEKWCAQAFGALWDNVRSTFDERVDSNICEDTYYLGQAAVRKWAT